MSGFELWAIACIVTLGTLVRSVKSTESPERAAHAAAGIAYGGRWPDATITWGDGLPRIAVKKRSMAAAVAYGFAAEIFPLFMPGGAGGLGPIRITWALRARAAPRGFSCAITSDVATGSFAPSLASS